jgi:hypothetical protein
MLFASLFHVLGSPKIEKCKQWFNAFTEYIDDIFCKTNFPAINNASNQDSRQSCLLIKFILVTVMTTIKEKLDDSEKKTQRE